MMNLWKVCKVREIVIQNTVYSILSCWFALTLRKHDTAHYNILFLLDLIITLLCCLHKPFFLSTHITPDALSSSIRVMIQKMEMTVRTSLVWKCGPRDQWRIRCTCNTSVQAVVGAWWPFFSLLTSSPRSSSLELTIFSPSGKCRN